MTWTWERSGPREWRVSIDTRPQWQRDAEREMNAAMRKVTPEEMAEFYARHHRYHDPRPGISDETWLGVPAALRPWARVLPKGWENGT